MGHRWRSTSYVVGTYGGDAIEIMDELDKDGGGEEERREDGAVNGSNGLEVADDRNGFSDS